LNIRNSTDLFQNPGINLRGTTPLIVIDGIPDRTADLWRVNADDIDNISVLKGQLLLHFTVLLVKMERL
jgi:hypothetical protein